MKISNAFLMDNNFRCPVILLEFLALIALVEGRGFEERTRAICLHDCLVDGLFLSCK